jgi:YD repeat-containing protein
MLSPSVYAVWSRRTELSYGNGTACRLLDVNNVTDTGQLKYAYSYDDVGNRLSMSVTDSSGTKIHVYDYDNIHQVTDVNDPEMQDSIRLQTSEEGLGLCPHTSRDGHESTDSIYLLLPYRDSVSRRLRCIALCQEHGGRKATWVAHDVALSHLSSATRISPVLPIVNGPSRHGRDAPGYSIRSVAACSVAPLRGDRCEAVAGGAILFAACSELRRRSGPWC